MKREHTLPQNKHKDCSTVIFWKRDKNGFARPGLYCSEHFAWIKWLSDDETQIAISLGVEDRGLLQEIKPPHAPNVVESETKFSTKLKSLISNLEV